MMKRYLSRHPLFEGETIEGPYLLEGQGFSNENHRFSVNGKHYLLRKFILDDRDRELEFAVQTLAYEKGIAAKPLVLESDSGLMICEFLPGEHKKSLEHGDLKHLARIIRELHTIQITSEPLPLRDLLASESREVTEAFDLLSAYPREIVLCHNDLNPKNILFSDEEVKLIDWEFAGNNDRYFDLAAVSVEFALGKEKEVFFLQQYFKEEKWEQEKLDAYKVIYKALCAEWFQKNT